MVRKGSEKLRWPLSFAGSTLYQVTDSSPHRADLLGTSWVTPSELVALCWFDWLALNRLLR